MSGVFKAIGRVAEQNVTVLVRGESGCGKELVARAIFEHSPRRDKPFVAVNCAAIPDQLLESELFGVEKGAYTGADRRCAGKFEHCDGGTIFLDEIGDMSMVVQGKVLRIIQEQTFQRLGSNTDIATDVRIIAATHRNLEDLVSKGLFREDLFYRLNGYTINLPPLRERRDDIAPLLEYFLNRARVEMNKSSVEGLTPAALEAWRLIRGRATFGNCSRLSVKRCFRPLVRSSGSNRCRRSFSPTVTNPAVSRDRFARDRMTASSRSLRRNRHRPWRMFLRRLEMTVPHSITCRTSSNGGFRKVPKTCMPK